MKRTTSAAFVLAALLLITLALVVAASAQALLIGGGNSPQEFYASKPYAPPHGYAQPQQKQRQLQAVAAKRRTKR
jgi:hypothetical protein